MASPNTEKTIMLRYIRWSVLVLTCTALPSACAGNRGTEGVSTLSRSDTIAHVCTLWKV